MSSAKQNTPGLGIEYEVHVPAYFALLLNTNPEIEDFKLQSNVQGFGNLDDLLVNIKIKGSGNLYFGFQLKHKENSDRNNLLPANFEAKGDFNLEKYCKAFKELNEENRKRYHFILFTNKNFDSSRTNEVKKFDMKHDESCLGRNFFDTSDNRNNLYKFELKEETEDGKNLNKKDYEEFLSKFSLFTGQANARDLEKYILDILKYKECYTTYIDFFRRWHRGDFTDYKNKFLDKKTFNFHLVDILLSSVAINYYFSDGQDRNLIFFEETVQQFDITIIDSSKQEFIKQLEEKVHKYPEEFNKQEDMIRLAKDHKLIDRFAKELKEETKLKLLHYFYQKPLILDFQSSQDVIYEASKLCRIQENEIKLVILGQNIDARKFSHLKIFTNLTGIDGNFLEETKRRCKLSLQGRNISFEEIFEDEIREFVTPREVFQMLKGNFSIGEDKENLPECYISRIVSTTVFDIESIIKHSTGSDVVIFYYEERFEELKILIQNIVNPEDYLYEKFLDAIILRKKEPSKKQLHLDNTKDTFPETPTIILRKEEVSRKQIVAICKKIGIDDFRLFKVIDEKRCLLLMGTKDTSFKEIYESSKISVEENTIHIFFNNPINILCAQPGMGKSTLMKYLKNECDPKFWTLRVDLKAHNQFLIKNQKIEDVLIYFLQLEDCQDLFLLNIKKMFLRKKKIVLFLDGLDEVENECVDCVLKITRQLSEMGFRIWLSSRQNLQHKIEQYFNIFSIEINELDEDQQKNYIENRLTSLYNKNEIEEIVEKIFSNTNLANNRQILEIPLQLQIITQIFLDDKSHYSNLSKNNFILTKMFEIFFEGKYKHYLAKIELKHTHLLGKLEEQLENYEIVALHSVLDDEHFQKLQIIDRSKLTQLKNSDFLGLITEVNRENKAVFEHLTYAEYFASKYLVKNFDKARILKEEIFSDKYQNLRIIFDVMLAEDSPLHLAIIYRDLDQFQDMMEESSLVDKGGRNFLQVAACIATRHPPLESDPEPITSECLVMDFQLQHFKGEDSTMKEIVNLILSSGEPFKNDEIFEWNSLHYALASGALYILEAILEKSEQSPKFFYKMLHSYYRDEVIAYYSIRFGYHRLLFEILAKKTCHMARIICYSLKDSNPFYRNNSILHFIFLSSEYTNRIRIVELLTGTNINKTVYKEDGYTFLHFAVLHGDTELIKILLEKKADLNVKDKDGSTPLHWAVKRSRLEISKLLVEKGASINIKDNYGWSPLLLAVRQNNLEISKLLVEKGADVNIKRRDGRTALFWAVDRINLEMAKLLIEKGADVNIKDKDGKSPLLLAVERYCFSKLRINFGVDVKIRNRLAFLVEKGADANIKDKDGGSSLHLALEINIVEISKLLLERGADVNCSETKQIKTPSLSIIAPIRRIFRKEANVHETSKISPVLRLAVKSRNFNLVQILIENGAIWDAQIILDAMEDGNIQAIDLFLAKGGDLSKVDDALHRVVGFYNVDVVNYLIEIGADVNLQKDGFTILHEASSMGHLKTVEILVNNPKTAHLLLVPDSEGSTCLHLAVYHGHVEVVDLLLGTEIDLGKIDIHNKKYPLHFAARDGRLQKELLIAMTRAIYKFFTSSDGKNGWGLHRFGNTKKIIEYFENHPINCNFLLPTSCVSEPSTTK